MKKQRMIGLPDGRWVTMGEYVRSWRELKRIVAVTPEREVTGWHWYPVPAREVLAEIVRGVHDRINQRVPYVQRGGLKPTPKL